MIRLDHRQPVPETLRGGIVALGNFDGFHLGHQAVVREAVEWAWEQGRPAIVATFDPHPVRHFAPHVPAFRLTTLDQREELFAQAGAEATLVFHFDGELAGTTAEDFVVRLLGQHIGACGVVTGEDFTFGKGRGGNLAVLRETGAACGIEARAVGPVMDGGRPVSSSRIRDALKAGDCAEAARLLTRPFAIRGQCDPRRQARARDRLSHGEHGTRQLPPATVRHLRGDRANLSTGEELKGAASLGIRPTFDPPQELLEPYFFDFDGELYGQAIEVALIRFLRPGDEVRFDRRAEGANGEGLRAGARLARASRFSPCSG